MERIEINIAFNGKKYKWAGDFDNVNTFVDESLASPVLTKWNESRLNKSRKLSNIEYEIDADSFNEYWTIELPAFDGDDYHF